MIKKLSSKISLPIYFSLAVFIIFLITVLITGILTYLSLAFGLLDERILQDKKFSP